MTKDNKDYRILVMEDNPGDFALVKEFLMAQVCHPKIVHALNFREGSEILSSGQAFNAILLDLSLPDKSGQELVSEMLLLASSCCPIIILTGNADIDFSIQSISQGILDYLIKDDLNATTLYKSILYAIERKKNVSDLKDSEKRYSDLFNLSPQPMWLFDPKTFRFVQVNKATTELYGYTEEEMLHMTLMDLKLEEDIAQAKADINNPSAQQQPFKSVVRHLKKSGEVIEVEIYSTSILINHKDFRSVIAIDVTEKNQQEHKIIKAIIKTQEDERYEIGGELHDNVCQLLAASQINLGLLKGSLVPSKLPLFNRCKEYISLASEEIRNLSHRLAPVFFEDSTMEEAFKRLFTSFNIDEKLDVLIDFDDTVTNYPLSLDIQLNLYRILQEQLRNIIKYANATSIAVEVVIYNHKLKMRISDNGSGFDVAAVRKGIGLANMRRRTELFSGKFEIDSSPGKGCAILIDIPLEGANEHMMADRTRA